jgi:hypothetical protein
LRLAALVLVALIAAPAAADYRAVMTALPGVLKDVYGSADVAKQDEDYVRRYNTYILDGIDGAYIPISILGQADESKFKQVCGGPAAVKITRQGNYRFSFVENYQGSTPVEYVYTYRLGNTFTYATNPDNLFKAHGIPVDDPRAATVITAELFASSGLSTVYKTEGMLVIQRNLTKPMVYARCDS